MGFVGSDESPGLHGRSINYKSIYLLLLNSTIISLLGSEIHSLANYKSILEALRIIKNHLTEKNIRNYAENHYLKLLKTIVNMHQC